MSSRIYTLGHNNRSLKEFIGLLLKYGIELLIDVRRWPKSSKFQHFDREILEEALKEMGIGYVWLGELLGGYRKGGYKSYMQTGEFERGLALLIRFARERRSAIMCSEKLWFKCHRRFIADKLLAHGWEVIHIIDAERVYRHKRLEELNVNREVGVVKKDA